MWIIVKSLQHNSLSGNGASTSSVSFSFLCGSSSEGEWGLLGAAPLRPLVRSDELLLGGLIRGITFRPTTVGIVLPATGAVVLATCETDVAKVEEWGMCEKHQILYMATL